MVNVHVMKVIFKTFLKEDLLERLEFHNNVLNGLEPDTMESEETQTIIDLMTKELQTR
jgi:hypothetical protein